MTARLDAFYAGGSTIDLTSSNVVVAGRWLHVAFAFDGKVLQLLENGTVTAELDAATVAKALDDNRANVLNGLRAVLDFEEADAAASRLIDRFPTWFDGGQLIADGKAMTAAAGHGPLSIEGPRSDPAQRWQLTLAANDHCVIRNAAPAGCWRSTQLANR